MSSSSNKGLHVVFVVIWMFSISLAVGGGFLIDKELAVGIGMIFLSILLCFVPVVTTMLLLCEELNS